MSFTLMAELHRHADELAEISVHQTADLLRRAAATIDRLNKPPETIGLTNEQRAQNVMDVIRAHPRDVASDLIELMFDEAQRCALAAISRPDSVPVCTAPPGSAREKSPAPCVCTVCGTSWIGSPSTGCPTCQDGIERIKARRYECFMEDHEPKPWTPGQCAGYAGKGSRTVHLFRCKRRDGFGVGGLFCQQHAKEAHNV